MRHAAVALGLSTLMCVASPGIGQELQHCGASDFWAVLIDPSLENGCLIQGEFVDGSVVRIGLDWRDNTGYVTAFHAAWGDIESRRDLPNQLLIGW